MKNLILTALLTASSAASAQVVGLHVGSVHDKAGFNDSNPGVYVRFDNGATIGTVYNSVRRQAFYAGWTWTHGLTDKVSAAVTVGGITGYVLPVTPMVIPSLAVDTSLATFRVAFLPKVNKGGANALTFMVERKF